MSTTQQNEPKQAVSRGEFLRSLGLSGATLMAFYCMGTLSSCTSNSGSDPTPNNGGNSGGNNSGAVDFTIDLTKDLISNGAFLINGNVIVARTTAGTFVALSKACTHQGTTVQYRSASNDFWCSNHGSVFSTTGSVVTGPASAALKVYKTSLIENNTKLRVTE